MMVVVFLTGQPGVGKTSAIEDIVEELKKQGKKVTGMVSSEIRESGVRLGFKIVDLSDNRTGTLAHVSQQDGPRVGKYRVNMHDLDDIGAGSIRKGVETGDVIVIDEVGPMELFSGRFKRAVEDAIKSQKHVIGTIHARAKDPMIERIKTNPACKIMEVTFDNRGTVPQRVLSLLK